MGGDSQPILCIPRHILDGTYPLNPSSFCIARVSVCISLVLFSLLDLPPLAQADGRHRVLAYNGDSDPGVSSMRSQNWTTSLGFPVVEAWRPFTLDGAQAVAGHVVTYAGNFQFAQIKGAGHMVPMYAPRESLVMLRAWLQDAPFPKFVPAPPAEAKN